MFQRELANCRRGICLGALQGKANVGLSVSVLEGSLNEANFFFPVVGL